MSKDKIAIEVVGGVATITFEPGWSTGRDDDTRPGIGFELLSDMQAFKYGDKFSMGCGVIRRSDAARLRDMLEIFLKAHARGEATP